MTLADMGFPSHEELERMGLTGRQFYDITIWMTAGRKKRFGDGWLRKVWPITGWEVLDFIKSVSR